ncbi:DAK2 domain-containing protein [Aeromicrobium camelliae]|uniref:DAK2 domain-containing protein n=2 Tax=Aeromicrobium camelliae TaxID=1538144 RepID=A0A3N6WPQ1_9ACTN|nr:DAK2 domain-containing protein [Aeromicrobium camelliae]
MSSGGAISVNREPVYAWTRRRSPYRRVVLVSGGGAGHEPMHAGFLGHGGLDVAIPGEVFTSPHNGQIVAAVERATSPGDPVLLLVKNYTGDVINFAIAEERLKANGRDVATLIIDDDLGSDDAEVGRRGTGATVVVEKILGAAADEGLALHELLELGTEVVARSRSLSVARAAHTAPSGGDAFEVKVGELEYGVGIHGESAAESIADPGVEKLVERMIGELLDAVGPADHGYLVFVNGLGGVSNLELAHVAASAAGSMRAASAPVASIHYGTYVSALDMRGFSITLTAVHEERWLGFWFAHHATPGLPTPSAMRDIAPAEPASEAPTAGPSSEWLDEVARRFADYRSRLNDLDQRSGDGDMGTNMADGTRRAAARGGDGLAQELRSLADAYLDEVGGSSGPLFGLVLAELARAAEDEASAERLAHGLRAGLEALQRVGGAQPGDRTMIDALAPAAARDALDAEAVRSAVEGARATSQLRARRGRASYLADRVLGFPDPGAVAAALLLQAIAERLDPSATSALDPSALFN